MDELIHGQINKLIQNIHWVSGSIKFSGSWFMEVASEFL